MSQTPTEDYELFGGEAPDQTPQQRQEQMQKYAQPQAAGAQGPQGVRPASQGAGSSIADTAAAVARKKKEANRSALMHEGILVIGFLAIAVVGYFVVNELVIKPRERAEEAARQYEREEDERRRKADKERREEADKRRKEREAQLAAEREKRDAAEAAKRKAREEELAKQQRMSKAASRFTKLRGIFRSASIDYYRNAGDAERPDKVRADALFVCMFAGGGDGCEFYELRTSADGEMSKATVKRLLASGIPETIEFEQFNKTKLSVEPSLIFRDRGQTDGGAIGQKAYLFDPTRSKRGVMRPQPVPDAGGAYSPSKLDFGGLYDAVMTLGCKKTAFKYKVMVKGGGMTGPVPVKTIGLGDELVLSAFRDAVRAAMVKTSRGRRVTAADVDTALKQMKVSFDVERE